MFLQLESHCEGAAGKSASTHILGMIALQKLSSSKGLQKVARGETKDSEVCQFQRAEPHSYRQTKSIV